MLRVILIIGSLCLFVGAGWNYWLASADKELSIPDSEIGLSNELAQLDAQPLPSLFHNLAKLHELTTTRIANVSFVFENENAISSAADSKWGVDKIGKYYDIKMVVEGEYLDQIYILKTINREFSYSLLVKKIEADAQKMVLSGRLYGSLAG